MFILNSLIELVFNSFFLTGYISNSNTFPVPLDEEEERMYLEKLREGDKSAKSILIERNLRLVAHIVKKYSFPNKDSFDSTKGTRLATYASRCIENEILMLFRNNKKQKSEVYLQDPIGVDKEGNEFCLMDILSSEKDCVLDKVESNLQVKALYKKLSESLTRRESSILIMRYGLIDGKCKTQREIAKDLGISRSYVSRIEKKALKKLKKELYSKA